MNIQDMARRIVGNAGDFDMENLFGPYDPVENLEDAAEGSYEVLPHKTLRERSYGPQPLMVRPDYSGDFLKKLKCPLQPKIIEAAEEDSILDFTYPDEKLKHQEEPAPRILTDEYYDINRPGKGEGYDVLQEYWDRSWSPDEAPEISEDKVRRRNNLERVINSFFNDIECSYGHKPNPSIVVSNFLMARFPVEATLDFRKPKVAKLLQDFEQTEIYNKKKNQWRKPDVSAVAVRRSGANPALGRWSFSTGSGRNVYTTVFQFIPHRNIKNVSKLNVQVSCTCPSFLYWGAQFNAYMGDYLYGKIRPKLTSPRTHNQPDPGRFMVCKHVLACIPIVSHYVLQGVTPVIRKKMLIPKKIQVEKMKPEKLRIPMELVEIGEQPNIKRTVDNWNHMTYTQRRNFVRGLTTVDEVEFMSHRFPETATVFVAEKLKDLVRNGKTSAIRQEAKEVLRKII